MVRSSYFIPRPQSAIRVLYLVRVLYPSPYFIPSPQSAVRSPFFILTEFLDERLWPYGRLAKKYGITQLTSFALSADLGSRALKSYIYNFNYIRFFISAGWGYLINWNSSFLGHLNGFLAWGLGNLSSVILKKINIIVCRFSREGCWILDLPNTSASFILLGHCGSFRLLAAGNFWWLAQNSRNYRHENL